jgi:hypothetical protein
MILKEQEEEVNEDMGDQQVVLLVHNNQLIHQS